MFQKHKVHNNCFLNRSELFPDIDWLQIISIVSIKNPKNGAKLMVLLSTVGLSAEISRGN